METQALIQTHQPVHRAGEEPSSPAIDSKLLAQLQERLEKREQELRELLLHPQGEIEDFALSVENEGNVLQPQNPAESEQWEEQAMLWGLAQSQARARRNGQIRRRQLTLLASGLLIAGLATGLYVFRNDILAGLRTLGGSKSTFDKYDHLVWMQLLTQH